MTNTALACRDCALGLIKTARAELKVGNRAAASKLVNSARFYWRWYLQEV